MSNDYFNFDTPVSRNTLGRAEQINQIFQAIAGGFDLFPGADNLNQGSAVYYVDGGAANAYTVTMDPAIEAYTAGLTLLMKVSNTNTGVSTLNVNGLGVKTIRRYNGNNLVASDLVDGAVVMVTYNGTSFSLVSQHGGLAVEAAASALAAANSASDSSGSASSAAASAGVSTAQSGLASTARSGAETAQGEAEDARDAAVVAQNASEAALDNFDDKYLGDKAANPLVDNDGDALVTGAVYFNTVFNELRRWSGATWVPIISDANATRLLADPNVKTVGFTADSGSVYSCDTSSVGAFTMLLPATPAIGDAIGLTDYAGTFKTNNLTLGRNGRNIVGLAEDLIIDLNYASLRMLYIDATKGWIFL